MDFYLGRSGPSGDINPTTSSQRQNSEDGSSQSWRPWRPGEAHRFGASTGGGGSGCRKRESVPAGTQDNRIGRAGVLHPSRSKGYFSASITLASPSASHTMTKHIDLRHNRVLRHDGSGRGRHTPLPSCLLLFMFSKKPGNCREDRTSARGALRVTACLLQS